MVSDWLGYGAMFFGAALLHTAAFFLFYLCLIYLTHILKFYK